MMDGVRRVNFRTPETTNLCRYPISITTRREDNMRSLLLVASALLAFGATMTLESTDANAVVCARGVYRAGCAGPNAAVVVRKPVPVVRCTRVLVNGVYVKRCV